MKAVLTLLFGVLLMSVCFAESEGVLNKLLAPGPLMKGHAELENSDCLKCHTAGKGVPDSLCLDCHKDIRVFVEQKKGFHGLATQSCRECHQDHKGRSYDSIGIDIHGFDHGAKTGYKLEGKHAEIRCGDCHKDKYGAKSVRAGQTRYLGKQASCVSCHKKDDPHQFKDAWAKKDCNACHGLKSWKENVRFDHARDTHYKLEGKHAELKCSECHGPNKLIKTPVYKWSNLKQSQCLSCHQDFHKTQLSPRFRGGNCTACHSQTAWSIKSFDHSVTKYNLTGKHAEAKCVDCHKQKTPNLELKHFNFTGLRTDCLSCHKDFHLFGKTSMKNYGSLNQCTSCHNDTDWKQPHRFDHGIDTRYVLDGKHLDVECNECHVPKNRRTPAGIYQWPQLMQKTCENCHANPHLKEFSADVLKKQCTECHVTSGWYDMKGGKSFDHAKTRFPLTGSHGKLACADCHGTRDKKVFKFKSVALKFCIDCHTDVHRGQFSAKSAEENCTVCHTTTNFRERLLYDHKQARYQLTGAHATLKCEECHKQTGVSTPLTRPNFNTKTLTAGSVFHPSQFLFPKVTQNDCLSCHDDYHRGQLDSKCLSCHSASSWKPSSFVHEKQSRFKLRGKHESAKCSTCHKEEKNTLVTLKGAQRPLVRYKPLSQACADCHDDVHKGSFGKNCQECHVETGWKATRDFHKNFTLSGIHYMMTCNECHKDGRKLAGTSQMCVNCHAKDDVHTGTLPHCQDCHRQHFWEVSSFKHSLTLFPLRGAHRTIDCAECHKNGTYKGLSARCSSCHLTDAMGATSFSHSPIGAFMDCTNCHHNQFTFHSTK